MQNHRSVGWISWLAGDWRDAMTPPSLWNGLEWACDQCAALARAACCPADDINAAWAGGCAIIPNSRAPLISGIHSVGLS